MFSRFFLFLCLFSSIIFAQDFLPGTFWCASPMESNVEYGDQRVFMYSPVYVESRSAIRERMMPYYVQELKKQGVSKEIHTQGKKTVANFYYNQEGLLTKYESKEYYSEITLEYDENNNIKALVSRSDNYYSRTALTRDSLMRISAVLTDNNSFIYSYNKSGKLEKIVSKTPPLTVIWRLNDVYVTPGISFATNADSIEYDEYGRMLKFESGMDPNGGSANYDKSGRLVYEGYFPRNGCYTNSFTYKNNLIAKIQLETFNNMYQKTSTEVTNVKYEYKHKKKK